jgi:UDP-N-acetylglucosamine 4,6-dehydratase
MNVCIERGVQKALLISTDKASAPSTLYGTTKLCAERMWLCGNVYSAGLTPEFVGVRYGNVFGSAGSVIHAFDEQAITGRLTLTDPTATRFHITLSQAVDLVLRALKFARPGELYIPKLPSYRLMDLARAFMTERGITQEPDVIGLRPSEKQHEELICHNESTAAQDAEQEYILDPSKVFHDKRFSYNSGRNQCLGIPALRKLIRDGAA